MEPKSQRSDLSVIAETLNDIGDSGVLVSVALKDLIAEAPSPWRDEVEPLVERQFERLRQGEHGAFE